MNQFTATMIAAVIKAALLASAMNDGIFYIENILSDEHYQNKVNKQFVSFDICSLIC